MRVVAVVPAAGSGVRLGADVPKAFVSLHGRTVVQRAVAGLLAASRVSEVVVAVAADWLAPARELFADDPRVRIVVGSVDRSASVRAGLQGLDADVVLVHDAARCLTPTSTVDAVLDALAAGARAVVPVLPVTDTIKRIATDDTVLATVDRSDLRSVQTPQGFVLDVLLRAHQTGSQATDDAGLVEALGEPVLTVPGHPLAMKITTSFDLAVADSVLTGRLSV